MKKNSYFSCCVYLLLLSKTPLNHYNLKLIKYFVSIRTLAVIQLAHILSHSSAFSNMQTCFYYILYSSIRFTLVHFFFAFCKYATTATTLTMNMWIVNMQKNIASEQEKNTKQKTKYNTQHLNFLQTATMSEWFFFLSFLLYSCIRTASKNNCMVYAVCSSYNTAVVFFLFHLNVHTMSK